MRYKVRCYEKNIWELEVEADSAEEAEIKAEKHYDEFGFEHHKEISSPEGWYWKAEEGALTGRDKKNLKKNTK
tara:strand:- start:3493 stop:3711 length:219 start_codon:yes stop_codon:yes gene_type:complete